MDAANVSLPSLFKCQRAKQKPTRRPHTVDRQAFFATLIRRFALAGEDPSRTAGEKQEASSPAVSGGLGHGLPEVNSLFEVFSPGRHITPDSHPPETKKPAQQAGLIDICKSVPTA